MAFMAFVGAGTASATTLATSGVAENAAISINATLASGTSAILKDNLGIQTDTCTTSTVQGKTISPFTGTSVSGNILSLTFGSCTDTTTVLSAGALKIEWTSGTNGKVSSSGAEVTVFATALNASAVCKTGTGTEIGTFTGVKTGKATMDISTSKLNCGILGTATWTGTYTVTGPENLGVES